MFIKEVFAQNKPVVSCEIFPPKKDMPLDNVMATAKEIAALRPAYMSVTYGAGGGNSSNSVSIASYVQNDLQMTALAHLTCVGATKEKIHTVLTQLQSQNIRNILALRGDFPSDDFDREHMEYHYAYELVKEIKAFGDFSVGGACYPEGHVENPNKEHDIDNLKYKIEAGVDFLVTQMFFDNNVLYSFLYRLAAKNIHVPVTAGIMPITSAASIKRSCALSGTTLPPKFRAAMDRFADNPVALQQAGIAYATEQIIDLISNGVTNIHIYTMNKPAIARKIMDNISDIIGA